MTDLELILLLVCAMLATMAQVYRLERNDLAAFIVHTGMLEETEE